MAGEFGGAPLVSYVEPLNIAPFLPPRDRIEGIIMSLFPRLLRSPVSLMEPLTFEMWISVCIDYIPERFQ